MTEYISRELIITKINDSKTIESDRMEVGYNLALDDIKDYLEDIPSADVQPVKRGKWEIIRQNKFTGTTILQCTYCKNYFVQRDDTLNAGRGDANYCPNCGAIMKKEEQ